MKYWNGHQWRDTEAVVLRDELLDTPGDPGADLVDDQARDDHDYLHHHAITSGGETVDAQSSRVDHADVLVGKLAELAGKG